ncbi:hypothetical protein ACCH70_004211 [Vibrio vulnificus]|nr:hypothetical protein [Vibrio vulnificus]ELX4172072.1 hypothetical protein [Vibrio vulnificus]HAS8420123.1 hypothetical protein [Vibrio vulnificus]
MPVVQVQKNIIEEKLMFLEQLSKNGYARIYLDLVGFETSNSWEATRLLVLEKTFGMDGSLLIPDVEKKLAKVSKMLLFASNDLVQLFTSNDAQLFTSIRTALSTLKISSNCYTQAFPFEHKGQHTTVGFPVLTAVEEDDNGWAIYFSTPKQCRVKTPLTVTKNGKQRVVYLDDEETHHKYEIVYIPKKSDRIELRVSSDTYKKDLESTLIYLKEAFLDILRTLGIPFSSLKMLTLEKSIPNLYLQKGYGMVIGTQFISEVDRTLMPRSNPRNIDKCLREQPYHQAGEKVEKVRCVSLAVLFKRRIGKHNRSIKTRLVLECEASSDYNTCDHFVIKNPNGVCGSQDIIDHLIQSNV